MSFEDVARLNQELLDSFAGRDVDVMMRHYWQDPRLYTVGEGGQVTLGYDAAREFQAQFFAVCERIDVTAGDWWHAGSADLVLATVPFRLSAHFADGSSWTFTGRYTNARRQLAGTWKVVFEQVSADAPSDTVPEGQPTTATAA